MLYNFFSVHYGEREDVIFSDDGQTRGHGSHDGGSKGGLAEAGTGSMGGARNYTVCPGRGSGVCVRGGIPPSRVGHGRVSGE